MQISQISFHHNPKLLYLIKLLTVEANAPVVLRVIYFNALRI